MRLHLFSWFAFSLIALSVVGAHPFGAHAQANGVVCEDFESLQEAQQWFWDEGFDETDDPYELDLDNDARACEWGSDRLFEYENEDIAGDLVSGQTVGDDLSSLEKLYERCERLRDWELSLQSYFDYGAAEISLEEAASLPEPDRLRWEYYRSVYDVIQSDCRDAKESIAKQVDYCGSLIEYLKVMEGYGGYPLEVAVLDTLSPAERDNHQIYIDGLVEFETDCLNPSLPDYDAERRCALLAALANEVENRLQGNGSYFPPGKEEEQRRTTALLQVELVTSEAIHEQQC